MAEDILASLTDYGVDYLFANAGTDFPPIIEAYCGAGASGLKPPAAIAVAHENAAVAMAHGYYMVSGRPQAVMVHVNVGTANSLCAVLNAWRDNAPVLLFAGRTPFFEQDVFGARSSMIHWGQEMRDQAGMVREAVKWDYELKGASGLSAMIGRAVAISMTEPRGPVYLSMPREILAAPAESRSRPVARQNPTAPAHPDPEAIKRAAGIIAKADNPLILTARAGRDPRTVAILEQFATRFAVPVAEFWPTHFSISVDHPMHLGFDPGPLVADADAIVVLDTPVPWIPGKAGPGDDCPVIQIGPDPLFSDYPIRGFPVTVGIASSVATALTELDRELGQNLAAMSASIDQRRPRISALHDAERAKIASLVGAESGGRLTAAYVSHCIGGALDDSAIVVNELGAVIPALGLTSPGSYFSVATSGGLGWGLPAALGAKLAAPDRLVVATLGDGSYMFANPVVCHQLSQAQNLPILTVVFNNAKWGAVERSTLELYPDGAAAKSNQMPLTALEPSPRFETIVEASGGYGERVDDAGDFPAALRRALDAIKKDGRQALLNVIIDG